MNFTVLDFYENIKVCISIGSYTKQNLTREMSAHTREKSITYNREKKHSPIKS